MRSSSSLGIALCALALGCSTASHVGDAGRDSGTDSGTTRLPDTGPVCIDSGHQLQQEPCACTATQWCAPGRVVGWSGGDLPISPMGWACVDNASTTQREGEACSWSMEIAVRASGGGGCSGPTSGWITFAVSDCASGLLCDAESTPPSASTGACRAVCDAGSPRCPTGLECTLLVVGGYACTPPALDAGMDDAGTDAGALDAGIDDAAVGDAGLDASVGDAG
jgi:hypothetical protein